MKIAVIPSNQHLNTYKGTGGLTEEDVMVRAGRAARYEFERQGHEAQMFWTAGAGTKSTDELAKMMKEATSWAPDLMLSLHSDAGSGGERDIYPLIGSEADREWATLVAADMATRVGFVTQAATVRAGLLFFSMSKGFRRILLEVGQHDNLVDAAFNAKYAEFLGVMGARALLSVEGQLIDDGPVTCEVPPGQERWTVVENPSLSGLFAGYPDGSYGWNECLTRGQADRVLAVLVDRDAEMRRGLAAAVERIENLEAATVTPPGVIGGSVRLDTPVGGVWGGTSKTLSDTISGVLSLELAPFYVEYGLVFGLRADVLWAQMALETANLKFGGVVKAGQNNWCGLKTKDGKGFASFPNPEVGVVAHYEHMGWYVKKVCAPPCGQYDPRHLGPHGTNGWVVKVEDLSGKWSPAADYAAKIVARAKQLGIGG